MEQGGHIIAVLRDRVPQLGLAQSIRMRIFDQRYRVAPSRSRAQIRDLDVPQLATPAQGNENCAVRPQSLAFAHDPGVARAGDEERAEQALAIRGGNPEV